MTTVGGWLSQRPDRTGTPGQDTLPLQLLVLAKDPVPGRVKTRLTPPFTPAQAADLAAASLADTLEAAAGCGAARLVLVTTAPVDGPLPQGAVGQWDVLPQRGSGLDERLAAAFDDASSSISGPGGNGDDLPLLLVGMDTPQLTPGLLRAVGSALLRDGVDAVLGPAADGGWWVLGLRRADAGLLLGVPMSTPQTGAVQRTRLDAAGLRTVMLPELVDVDTVADAWSVAAAAPGTRFAARLAELAAGSGVRSATGCCP